MAMRKVTRIEPVDQDGKTFYRVFDAEGLILDEPEGHKVSLNRPGQGMRMFQFPIEQVQVGDVLRFLGVGQ